MLRCKQFANGGRLLEVPGTVRSHEEHIAEFSRFAADCPTRAQRLALFDDNLLAIAGDVLHAYPPYASRAGEHPDEWYAVGVMMYALGETSRKRLPVDFILLGSLLNRVRERMHEASGDLTHADILSIMGLFALELFPDENGDESRIADVLCDYVAVVRGGTHDEYR